MTSAAIWISSPPVPHRERPPKPERVAADRPEFSRVAEALAAIPNNDLSYDEWFRLACAVHYATDGGGLDLFRDWSATSSKHDDEFLDNRVWPYIQTERGGDVITDRTLFTLAAQNGWQDPAVAEDFDAVETPTDDFDVLTDESGTEQAESDTAGGKLRFTPVPAAEFAVATPLRWIVKGVIPQAELAVMYGESGSGKSFMALDMVGAIARGVPWRGLKVHQGKVVYIAAEGAGGFRNRLRAYSNQNQIDLRDLPLHVIHAAPNMLDKTDALDVAKAVLHVVGKPAVIVIDTLAQTMPGGNENAGEDMGKVLSHCRGLHRATGALVLLVHHSGKDASKGARGWSGLRAASDVELEVLRADEDRVLSVTKQKDGDDGGEFGFKLETVLVDMDADGDEVTSCVVAHCDAVVRRGGPKGANQRLVLRVLDDLAGMSEEGVDRSDLITAVAEQMDFNPASGKKDRRREMATKAVDSVVDAGFATVEGTKFFPSRT